VLLLLLQECLSQAVCMELALAMRAAQHKALHRPLAAATAAGYLFLHFSLGHCSLQAAPDTLIAGALLLVVTVPGAGSVATKAGRHHSWLANESVTRSDFYEMMRTTAVPE
jgi:hypothetical protein